MRNYKLTISYDGSSFKGWQRLGQEDNSVQGTIERAFSKVLGYEVTIDGSGRTDAGVHANGQIANVKVAGKLEIISFLSELNEELTQDIFAKKMELVKNSFHSRLSAVGKCYCYTIDTREKPDVFRRKYTYHFTKKLKIENMRKAAKLLEGKYDFASFCDKKEDKSTIRTIHSIELVEMNSKIMIKYYGNGFLNHMVRILTGTLLEIGIGEKQPEDIPQIIRSKERANAGFTAPAKGLCLEQVFYE